MEVITLPGDVAFTYTYGEQYNIPKRTLQYYTKTKPGAVHHHDGKCFFRRSCLSKDIVERLPPKAQMAAAAKQEAAVATAATLKLEVAAAYHGKGYLQHIIYFMEKYEVNEKAAVKWGREYEAWKVIYNFIAGGEKNIPAEFEAASSVLGCKTMPTYRNYRSELIKEGAEYMAIDGRYRNSAATSSRATDLHSALAVQLVSDAAKMSTSRQYKRFKEFCIRQGVDPMSESWYQKKAAELLHGNTQVYEARHGASLANSKMHYYTPLQQARNRNTVWQIDGKTLSFLVQGEKKVRRWVLFTVVDAYSKMIVGWAIGPTENKELVMAALRDAIKNTSCMPHEIVADNSSFQKTQEAKYFAQYRADRQLVTTVTSNPKGKVVSERFNQFLDTESREIPGFAGIGPTAHSDDAQMKPEMRVAIYKNPLTANDIKKVAATVVKRYNETPLPKYQESPASLYAGSEQLYIWPMDIADNLQATIDYKPKAVRNGQLRFRLDRDRREFIYRLSPTHAGIHNNRSLRIRTLLHEEGIFIYSWKTDEFICFLKPLTRIEAASAEQDEQSIELYHKNAAQIKSRKVYDRKQIEEIYSRADVEHPNWLEGFNNYKFGKSMEQQILEDVDLQGSIAAHGGNPFERPLLPMQPTMEVIDPTIPGPLVKVKNHKIHTRKQDVLSND